MRRRLHSPALHFTLLGIVLFLVDLGWGGSGDEDARVLTIGPERVDQLRRQWQATSGRPPDAGEEDWLIEQWAEDEILYREALKLGMDREDPGVCYRLALNMKFLGLDRESPSTGSGNEPTRQELCGRARELGLHRGDPVVRRQLAELMRLTLRDGPALLRGSPGEISREEMQAYMERHRERFTDPPRVRLSHVFLSRDKRGDGIEEAADRLLERLIADGVSPRDAVGAGDPFMPGSPPDMSSGRDLERLFGKTFARAAMELPENRWVGPIRSGLGLHLVWIHERLPERLRPLEEVKEKVLLGVHRERAEQGLERSLEELRSRWRVQVERGNA